MELIGNILSLALWLLIGTNENHKVKGLPENFTESSISFANNIYSNITALHQHENIVISPFSIQTAGAILFSGASGITADQLATGLRLISRDRTPVVNSFKNILGKLQDNSNLKTMNKLFVKNGVSIKQSYHTILSNEFNSELDHIDFNDPKVASEKMNSWISEKTEGKITSIITSDAIDPLSAAFILNAVFFKSNWANEFPLHNTKLNKFWFSQSEFSNIKMMSNTKEYKMKFLYNYKEPFSGIAVELPFKNEYFSMVVAVPDKRTGLKDLETKLIKDGLKPLLDGYSEMKALVKLPIFKIECSLELKEIFMKMGMADIFDMADFSKMSKAGLNLKVGGITHKVVIEVNERGTEVAAVSGIRMSFRSMPAQIIADHPFMYIIKGQGGEIYFMGRYVKPEN